MFEGYLFVEEAFREFPSGREDISVLMEQRLRVARKLYHNLEPEYKFCYEAMEPEKKIYFTMLVKDYDQIRQKEQELMVKYKQVCRDKTERGEEIHTLRREKQERGIEIRTLRREKQERGVEIRRQAQEIKTLEKQKKTLEKEKAGLEKTVASIRASFSYRLGRVLTKPFRWIKSRLKA